MPKKYEPPSPQGGQFGGEQGGIPGNFDNPHPYEENPPAPAQHEDQEFSHWGKHYDPHYRYEAEDGTVHDVWYMKTADGWRIYDEWENP